jgi:hypothetical protein
MRSRKGFRVTMGALAFAALVAASPAAHAAARGHRPSVAPAPGLWQLIAGGIEARMVEVLRQLGWGEPGQGASKKGPMLPGAGVTVSGGSNSPGSSGASSDQSGTINPNGG